MRTIRISIVSQIQTHCKGITHMTSLAQATTVVKDEVLDSQGLSNDTPRAFDSHELFRGGREVVIPHDGRDYRLRRPRLGKLILTA